MSGRFGVLSCVRQRHSRHRTPNRGDAGRRAPRGRQGRRRRPVARLRRRPDQLDIPVGAVYEALAYCYNNPEEMRPTALRKRRHARSFAIARSNPRSNPTAADGRARLARRRTRSPCIAVLRSVGYDVLRAKDEFEEGTEDGVLLDFAAETDRVVFTPCRAIREEDGTGCSRPRSLRVPCAPEASSPHRCVSPVRWE